MMRYSLHVVLSPYEYMRSHIITRKIEMYKGVSTPKLAQIFLSRRFGDNYTYIAFFLLLRVKIKCLGIIRHTTCCSFETRTVARLGVEIQPCQDIGEKNIKSQSICLNSDNSYFCIKNISVLLALFL